MYVLQVDIFVYALDCDGSIWHTIPYQKKVSMCRRLFPGGFVRMAIEGIGANVTVGAPRDIIGYVTTYYGLDWRKPVEVKHWYLGAPCHR